MAIPANYTNGGGPQIDPLDVSKLTPKLLNDYYGSSIQKRDVMAVAEEIRRRHLAKLPTDTGLLKSTARVQAFRSKVHPDGRWEAEYSVGGARADYIVPLEDEHHYLDSVLNEMGFYVGDVVNGPTGRVSASDRRPANQNDAREADLNSSRDEERGTTRRPEEELRADVERKLASWGYTGDRKPDKERREMARYSALSDDEAFYLDRVDAREALRAARIGTANSEKKFNQARFHYIAALLNEGEGRDEGIGDAMEEHNRAREAAGLDPIKIKWGRYQEERPYR